jgi:predicted dehydrogenase
VNDAVHFADLATLVFEKPPSAALGVTRDFLGTGHEDVAFLALDFEGGELCHVEASYHAPGRARELLIVGERGSIAVDFDAREKPVALYRQAHRLEARTAGFHRTLASLPLGSGESVAPETPPAGAHEPLRAELEDFLENARAGRRPEADGWAGAQAVAAIEAALLSAREGRRVPIPQVKRC